VSVEPAATCDEAAARGSEAAGDGITVCYADQPSSQARQAAPAGGRATGGCSRAADPAVAGAGEDRRARACSAAERQVPLPECPGEAAAGACEAAAARAHQAAVAGAAALPDHYYQYQLGSAFQLKEERFSPGMMGLGIPLLALGGINMLVGLPLTLATEGEEPFPITMLSLGGAGLLTGIALTVMGAKKVQVLEPNGAAPGITVAGTNAALTWSF